MKFIAGYMKLGTHFLYILTVDLLVTYSFIWALGIIVCCCYFRHYYF